VGDLYLVGLADVLADAGLTVVQLAGWQTRARGSGGYAPGRPTHVMVHHTASNPGSDPDGDVAYIATGADAAPLANLYLSRSGAVTVIAAGATNTNGSGADSWGGGVPDDAMNEYAIGIEAANNGTGEPWPTVQQDAYGAMCAALCLAYGIPPHQVRGHVEWAPGRKIDPAGPSRWATSGTWNMDLFRDDLALEPPPPEPTPEPPPPEEDAAMPFIVENTTTGQIVLIYADGLTWGIAGADVPHWVDRFGPALPVSGQAEWDALLAKSPR
jgi:hypothetical protein